MWETKQIKQASSKTIHRENAPVYQYQSGTSSRADTFVLDAQPPHEKKSRPDPHIDPTGNVGGLGLAAAILTPGEDLRSTYPLLPRNARAVPQ